MFMAMCLKCLHLYPRDKCYTAVRALEARGARVVNITIPHLQAQSLAHGAQISTEFALTWDSMFHHRAEHMEDNTKVTIALGVVFHVLGTMVEH